jgi:hypothetical protein
VEVAFAQWFHGRRFANSIRSQLAPSSLSMLRGSALHAQRVPTSLLCCACLALACASLILVPSGHNLLACSPQFCRFYANFRCRFLNQSQFLAQDPIPGEGFWASCTLIHFFARFGTHSRGDAQVAHFHNWPAGSQSQFYTDSTDSGSCASVIDITIRLVDFILL